jgi:hypothetical protein
LIEAVPFLGCDFFRDAAVVFGRVVDEAINDLCVLAQRRKPTLDRGDFSRAPLTSAAAEFSKINHNSFVFSQL